MKRMIIGFLMVLLIGSSVAADQVNKKLRFGLITGWGFALSSDAIRGDDFRYITEDTVHHQLEDDRPALTFGIYLEWNLSHKVALQLQLDGLWMNNYDYYDVYESGVLVKEGYDDTSDPYVLFSLTLNLIRHFSRKNNRQFFLKGGIGPSFEKFALWDTRSERNSSRTDFFVFNKAYFHVQAGGGVRLFVGKKRKSNFQIGAMIHYLIGQNYSDTLHGFYLTLHLGYKI